MLSKHLKRLDLSRAIQVPRKEFKFATKPRAGPHANEKSIALGLILRDYLHLSDTMWETKKILASRAVQVNGKVITDHKFPVGFMDVLSIPSIKRYYRVLYDTLGRLRLVEIQEQDAKWKLSRIEDISTVKDGKFQYHLHDGTNLIMDRKVYGTGDSLQIDLEKREIISHIPLAENTYAFIIGGKNVGRIGRIESYKVVNAITPNMVRFKEGFETARYNVFPVGTIKPLVQLPEVRSE
ncbi:MAG: 30S ribosomal protein S4e [Thermoplasmata archaeon]|jgi:small subunit ribosomal protein S4e|nr:30S ribosomal protein S4e [Thermoplasmatales archaeon]